MHNKRYRNINIHGNGFFWNLGLIRIKGKFSAELCSDLISQKLSKFGIVFGKDVVSIKDDDGSDDDEGCNDDNGLVFLAPKKQKIFSL